MHDCSFLWEPNLKTVPFCLCIIVVSFLFNITKSYIFERVSKAGAYPSGALVGLFKPCSPILGYGGNGRPKPGNTKGGSITVLLTSCLTGLESAVCLLTNFVFICQTD
jgi:hypothetical protein